MTNKNIEKYLWSATVSFITCMLLGSFFVSGKFIDISYIVILNSFVIIIKILGNK